MIMCDGAKPMVIMRNCAIKLTIVKVQIALQFSLFTLVLYKCTLCTVHCLLCNLHCSTVQVYIVQFAMCTLALCNLHCAHGYDEQLCTSDKIGKGLDSWKRP